MTFFSLARRTCGTTHFIRPCTILHATGFGLPPNFEDCSYRGQMSISIQKKNELNKQCCFFFFISSSNENSWYLGDNKSAITLIAYPVNKGLLQYLLHKIFLISEMKKTLKMNLKFSALCTELYVHVYVS